MVAKVVLVCVALCLISSAAYGQQFAENENATKADIRALGDKITDWQRSTDDRIARLEERVRAMSDVQESSRQALAQIAQKDQNGNSYIRIDASHEPTRKELHRAIQDAAPKTGTVIIRNTMATDENVAINGKMYEVFAGHDREVSVPYQDFRVKVRNKPIQVRSFMFPHDSTIVTIRPESTPQVIPWSGQYITYVW